MSKELTPLEAWERANNNAYEHGYEISGDLCYIIETALERLEQIETNQTIFENNPITVGKKIMALEIIKEIFEIKISIDENENDKSCGMVFLVSGKDLIWTIYETFDKENIQKLKLLKEIFK